MAKEIAFSGDHSLKEIELFAQGEEALGNEFLRIDVRVFDIGQKYYNVLISKRLDIGAPLITPELFFSTEKPELDAASGEKLIWVGTAIVNGGKTQLHVSRKN